jgi:hypothetical protein
MDYAPQLFDLTMWKPNVIAAKAGQTLHVTMHLNSAVDQVRRAESGCGIRVADRSSNGCAGNCCVGAVGCDARPSNVCVVC